MDFDPATHVQANEKRVVLLPFEVRGLNLF